jgi:uncharacterized membrane protein
MTPTSSFLNIIFFFLFWFSIAVTPAAIYLNIKKESIQDPSRRAWYKKWGIITLVLGPVLLLILLPFIASARYFTLSLGI